MIYVCTVHHRQPRWVGPQLDALARHMSEPYRVHAVVDGVDGSRFDRAIAVEDHRHAPRLNLLAADLLEVAADDDWLMFLDSDAFPIADPIPVVRDAFEAGAVMVAARRNDGIGTPWPHPLFCVTTVGWWREHGDWRPGPKYLCGNGERWSDAGARLLEELEHTRERWVDLTRTNPQRLHPLFFGIYGDLIYHHGAGSRRPISKADVAAGGDMTARAEANRATGDRLYRALVRDPEFWKELA